ncbi:MAG: hypothetical protein O4805_20555 [Trichodesmium sp. St16_bin2-tuft]|nr:hypothetical protein [Trichodesmium sp. St16_bin2-tuft]
MPSPLVEAGIEQQACLGLYRFHEAELGFGKSVWHKTTAANRNQI